MNHHTDIAIPPKLQGRPLYHGFPIPYSVVVVDGVPDFRISDEKKRTACVRDKLCGLCGQPMTSNFCFMGGPSAAQYKIFFDPAMHRECASYAMKVCPYFAFKNHQFAELEGIHQKHEGGEFKIVDLEHREEKPDRLMILTTDSFDAAIHAEDKNRTVYARANRVKSIDWFRWNSDGRSEYDHTDSF